MKAEVVFVSLLTYTIVERVVFYGIEHCVLIPRRPQPRDF